MNRTTTFIGVSDILRLELNEGDHLLEYEIISISGKNEIKMTIIVNQLKLKFIFIMFHFIH